MIWNDSKLAILAGGTAAEWNGESYINGSYGRIIEELSKHFRSVVLCVPYLPEKLESHDFILPKNIKVYPLPPFVTALDGLKKHFAVAHVYRNAIRDADFVFVRGVLIPAVGVIYSECARLDKPLIHWIPGNPMALLESHSRDGQLKDFLGKQFVKSWEKTVRNGHKKAFPRAAYLSNGSEIAERYPSVNNYVTVSTTLRSEDFCERNDACLKAPFKILSLCVIRPEKGIEYLIEAFAMLEKNIPSELVFAGGRGRYGVYQQKLDALVEKYGIADKVRWLGHVPQHEVSSYLRQADVLVLPTLSEGTPRVLMEAMANCAPVVATNVGGIPDLVVHGENGLLVPPKDPQALFAAMRMIIEDSTLRRRVVENGYARAKQSTVETLVGLIMCIFEQLDTAKK